MFDSNFKRDFIIATRDRCDFSIDRIRAVRTDKYKYIKNYMPNRSYTQPAYRDRRAEFVDIKKAFEAGELNEVQAKYWLPTKPEEELYDLQQDPSELQNLAKIPEMQDTLMRMWEVLNGWIENTNDLGRVPEKELIAKWLPNGQQQQLPPLELEEKEGKIRLLSIKADATILWKQPQDSLWTIYKKPLPSDGSFEAKAQRIGFLESEAINYNIE